MQEAVPFRTYVPATTGRMLSLNDSFDGGNSSVLTSGENYVQQLVLQNSVIVFGKRGCCMCHVVKKLLLGLGVNPSVFEVDEREEAHVMNELLGVINGDNGGKQIDQVQFPAVFVGGKLFGGLERVMATHISGELVPILKEAGALWL